MNYYRLRALLIRDFTIADWIEKWAISHETNDAFEQPLSFAKYEYKPLFQLNVNCEVSKK